MSKKSVAAVPVFSSNKRANDILKVIMSYAELDFSKKIELSQKNDTLDGIGAGVNMLGEELRTSTISLKEKEHLLKEIHHRVKNNLQIVSSLLSLQSENVLDEKYLSLIRDSKNRIASMALVHEMLYASKSLERINANEYITRLTQNLAKSIGNPDLSVKMNYDIQPEISFDIDCMIPMGLILNEIISNSFKYAFPQTSTGKIFIGLEKQESSYVLVVNDNGVGLPKNFSIDESNSLGMQLIRMLCEQMDATLLIQGKKGVDYKITCPLR